MQDREQRLYVMKVIDMSRMDGKMRKDAVNEVKVLSSLKHPYIVSYRESFTENRQLAIVMDYAEGGDIAGVIGLVIVIVSDGGAGRGVGGGGGSSGGAPGGCGLPRSVASLRP